VTHHRRGLRRLLKDDELAEAIVHDHATADLDERRRAMLAFADKLTRAPASMTGADAQALRGVGFEDPEILAIVEVTSYYAYANRIVGGLGVELE
jgi:uncharacterized peroxidase-related enzyme